MLDVQARRSVKLSDYSSQASLSVSTQSRCLPLKDLGKSEGDLENGWCLSLSATEAEGEIRERLVIFVHPQGDLS